MMNRLPLLLLMLLFLANARGQTLERWVVASAGGTFESSSAGLSMSWTLGQPVASELSNQTAGITLAQGFQQGGGAITSAPELLSPSFSAALYPNPAQGVSNLSIALPEPGVVNVTIMDLTGRTVLADRFQMASATHTQPLAIASLRAGIYLVRVQAGESLRVLKLIVGQ